MTVFRVELLLGSLRNDGLLSIPTLATDTEILESPDGYVLRLKVDMIDAGAAKIFAREAATRLLHLMSLSSSAFRLSRFRMGVEEPTLDFSGTPWHNLTASVSQPKPDVVAVSSMVGRGMRDITAEVSLYDDWEKWPSNVRSALSVFYEAQSAEILDVRTLLLMSAMEMLIEPRAQETALGSLNKQAKRAFTSAVDSLANIAGVPEVLRKRLTESLGGPRRDRPKT